MKFNLWDNTAALTLEYLDGEKLYIEKAHIAQMCLTGNDQVRIDLKTKENNPVYMRADDVTNLDFHGNADALMAYLQETINNFEGAGTVTPIQVSIPDGLPEGQSVIGMVSKYSNNGYVRFTRSADTTPYDAHDIVNADGFNYFVFNATWINSSTLGTILRARIFTDQPECTARFRIHVYRYLKEIPDNAPFNFVPHEHYDIEGGDIFNWSGCIDMPAMTPMPGAPNSLAFSENNNANLLVFNNWGNMAVYGLLETLDPFTPAVFQNFWLEFTNITQ